MNEKAYTDWRSMSDASLSLTIGEFIKHHRLEQNLTQGKVAGDAGISRSTLSLMEGGEPVALSSLLRVLRVLDLLSIMDGFRVFFESSPIELAERELHKRKRASGSEMKTDSKKEW